MGQSKIEVFSQMVREQPDNEMIWYGLASEYMKEERWQEATEALRKVLSIKADYTAAFQLLGMALMRSGAHDEARQAWRDGIEVATHAGAWRARDHMQGLLDGATTNETGLCL